MAKATQEDKALEQVTGKLAVPDYITGREGTEQIERQDVTYPRLGLCQSLTPQKKKSDANHIPNLTDGQFFNTITGEIYGESVLVVPILFSKQRIKFHPMSEGGGIECQSFNGKDGGFLSPKCEELDGTTVCEHAKFSDNHRPTCDKLHNRPAAIVKPIDRPASGGIFFCEVADIPIIISLKSTGLKVSKQWNSLVKLNPNTPMFARVYELISTEVTKGQQSWFAPTIKPRGFVPPDLFRQLKTAYDSLKDVNITADMTGMETEEAPDETGAGF